MALKRREFLERAGWALAGLGFGGAVWDCAETRFVKALAETPKRKLALLVGVNQYGGGSLPLLGCLTDVELQRELLLYRFGFQNADILTLTDSQATAANIRAAFIDHLVEQARPGDAVVFHFSGYGRRMEIGGDDLGWAESSSLVPVDGVISAAPNGVINDLSVKDLFLLLRSLSAENVLAVLDTSYVYPGSSLQGSLRVRSLPAVPVWKMGAQEEGWIEPLKAKLANAGDLKGKKDVLMGARPEQVAGEMQWSGFSAGVFTYALTQTLWQTTPASRLTFILNQAACTVERLTGIDIPQLENLALEEKGEEVLRSFLGGENQGADGVCTAWDAESKTAQLWLGGLPAQVLDCYGANSILSAVGATPAWMVVRSRSGLMATAQVLAGGGELSTGQFVREAVRVVPRNVSLTVGLDSSLERIERVDATSAFSAIPNVSPVAAGSFAADCLFGRLRETLIAQAGAAALPAAKTSYGLFSLAQNIIPNTVGEGGEAVKSAVRRLAPHLHILLAAKLWRLTANESSSLLACRAALELVEDNQSLVLQERGTLQGEGSGGLKEKAALVLPAGSRIQYRLHNESESDIYYVLLGMDNRGRAFASAVYDPGDGESGVVRPGESMTIPSESSGGPFLLRGAGGLAEAQLICCREPLTKTLAGLAAVMSAKADGQPVSVLANPMPVAMALLQDLHDSSVAGVAEMGVLTDGFALDMRVWATLSFFYRVV
ncbi:caspase family protein [Ancylothrix sp. C2]|uniref:caspase family protein n=1 Tax=Ancylothrix sp. D3o TaxID=2953691 RepID=UPI0021BB0BBA|nr:caspase family protein [Ancylothrix sp. D3o]MCT7951914.1 caspase family protein [Ancylothrix sp. D3o]